MSILRITLPLTRTKIKLSYLVQNILNSTFQTLNEHFDILNRQEFREFFLYKSKIFKSLTFIDILRYFDQRKEELPIADEIAECFEEIKSLFFSKCDLRTAISLKIYGYYGTVSNALINLVKEGTSEKSNSEIFLKNPDDESIIYKRESGIENLMDELAVDNSSLQPINTLIKIYLFKEDVSIYDTVEIKNGILTLKKDSLTFKLTLCGSHSSPVWAIISPKNFKVSFNLLPVYIKKFNTMKTQKEIYEKYKEISSGYFQDFEIYVFDSITLRLKNGYGAMKIFGDRIYGNLDINWYVDCIIKQFSGEIANRYEYLNLKYKMWFVIGEGLHFIEEDERKENFLTGDSNTTNISENKNVNSEIIGSVEEKNLRKVLGKEILERVFEYYSESNHAIFRSLKEFKKYFVNHQKHPFYTALMSIVKKNKFFYVKNYKEHEFGTRNMFLKKNENFVCVRCDDNHHRIFVGRIIKYNLLRYIELYMCIHSKESSDVLSSNNLEDNFKDLSVEYGPFLTNVNGCMRQSIALNE